MHRAWCDALKYFEYFEMQCIFIKCQLALTKSTTKKKRNDKKNVLCNLSQLGQWGVFFSMKILIHSGTFSSIFGSIIFSSWRTLGPSTCFMPSVAYDMMFLPKSFLIFIYCVKLPFMNALNLFSKTRIIV